MTENLDYIKELEKNRWLENLPMMTDGEISKVETYLKSDSIVFEWGCGGSTIYFPKFVKKYVSVEHDISWFKRIRNKIRQEKIGNVELYYVPPDLSLFSQEPSEIKYRTYLDFIDTLPYKRYDVIIVDGRARDHSAIKSLKYMDENTVLLFHDYYRKGDMHWIESHFNFIDKLDGDTTLAIMKKKEQ